MHRATDLADVAYNLRKRATANGFGRLSSFIQPWFRSRGRGRREKKERSEGRSPTGEEGRGEMERKRHFRGRASAKGPTFKPAIFDRKIWNPFPSQERAAEGRSVCEYRVRDKRHRIRFGYCTANDVQSYGNDSARSPPVCSIKPVRSVFLIARKQREREREREREKRVD